MKPFEVYNPIAGRWFILRWWTDEERGHLVFASSEESLKQMAASVFKKKPYATLKEVLEIEVVGPSSKMNLINADHDVREEKQTFIFDIFARLAEARDAGRKLPPPFVPCEMYAPEEGVKNDEWAREKHYGCQRCMNAIRVVNMTHQDLYLKFYEGWKAVNPKPTYTPSRRQPVRVLSTAAPADDDEPLWYAHANFGDHAGGIELQKVDLKDSDDFRPQCLAPRVLFFFRLIKKLEGQVVEDITEIAKTERLAAKEQSKKREEARKVEWDKERKQKISVVIDFFRRTS